MHPDIGQLDLAHCNASFPAVLACPAPGMQRRFCVSLKLKHTYKTHKHPDQAPTPTHTHTLSLSLPFCLPFCLSFFRSSPGSLLCATCTAHSHHALCCRSDLGKQVCIIFHATCHQGTWAWNGCALVCVKKRNEPSVFHQRLSSFRLTVQLLCCFHALISCRHQDGENCCTVWIPLVSCHLCLADENPPWRHTHTHTRFKHSRVLLIHSLTEAVQSQLLLSFFRSFVLSFFRSFVLSFTHLIFCSVVFVQ